MSTLLTWWMDMSQSMMEEEEEIFVLYGYRFL